MSASPCTANGSLAAFHTAGVSLLDVEVMRIKSHQSGLTAGWACVPQTP